MFPQNFTNKSQQLLQMAAQIAAQNGQQQVEPPHLFFAMLEDEEGVANSIISKMGANPITLRASAQSLIDILPKQASTTASITGQVMLGQAMMFVFQAAASEAQKMGDEYISVEHLFLAFLSGSNPINEILNKENITYDSVLKTLATIRGNQRVDSPEPETRYNALEKYGKNLTDLARKEKIDPVIGRDDEVR
ncbi:MAG: hypothetical protein NT034_01180, partial [Candidatus Magasanikbacteria bacterium]|nr:hypothetical protein [Candidatus Magasanikbacteria bacterium]